MPETGRVVYGLVQDISMASQIVKYAKQAYSRAWNFDRADALLGHVKKALPFLIILDFEHCEREAFLVLKEIRENADLKSVAVVGFLTQKEGALKSEAEKAGCFRVYRKTEFTRELPDLITRYAL